ALAAQLARRGHDVVLWGTDPAVAASINEEHRNPRYIREVVLPSNLRASENLEESVARGRLLVPAVPSHALREVMGRCADAVAPDAAVCSATKGIEEGTLDTVAEVLRHTLPERLHDAITILSGPSFALETARGLPTAVVVAGRDEAAHFAAEAFHGDAFR